MKSIIIYYSYGGNTKRIANLIHDKKGYDMVEIKPVDPYTNDYQKLVDEEENKMHQEEIVEIEPIHVDLSNYDMNNPAEIRRAEEDIRAHEDEKMRGR